MINLIVFLIVWRTFCPVLENILFDSMYMQNISNSLSMLNYTPVNQYVLSFSTCSLYHEGTSIHLLSDRSLSEMDELSTAPT